MKMKMERTSNLSRKRVMMPKPYGTSNCCYDIVVPLQKRQSRELDLDIVNNNLQALPLDILVKILCKVDHSDLKQLLLVSKFVSEAASIAKELHFAFSTPLSKPAYNELKNELSEQEGPNAPMQQRIHKSRIEGLKISSIAVALFASPDDEWPKNEADFDV